jgi:hypothetical protein
MQKKLATSKQLKNGNITTLVDQCKVKKKKKHFWMFFNIMDSRQESYCDNPMLASEKK